MQFNTARLSCSLLSPADEQDFCALYSDAKVMRKICAPFSSEQAQQYFQRSLHHNTLAPYKQLSWVICQQDNQQFLGVQGLIWQNAGDEKAEAGIMLVQKASNKGIATEAITGLLQYAFSQLQLKQVFAHYQPTNKAVEIFVRKIGFTIEHDIRPTKLGEAKYCFIEKCHLLN